MPGIVEEVLDPLSEVILHMPSVPSFGVCWVKCSREPFPFTSFEAKLAPESSCNRPEPCVVYAGRVGSQCAGLEGRAAPGDSSGLTWQTLLSPAQLCPC